MVVDFSTFVFYLLCTQILFWSTPHTWVHTRRLVLFLSSILVVLTLAPAVLIAILIMSGVAYVSIFLLRNMPPKPRLTGTIIVAVFLTAILVIWSQFDPRLFPKVGLSYVLLKLILYIREEAENTVLTRLSFLSLLNGLVFAPAYPAGPIYSPRRFSNNELSSVFCFSCFADGWTRIIVGTFKIYFLSGVLIDGLLAYEFRSDQISSSEFGFIGAWTYVILKFLLLYFNFSGYTDIAVGAGKTFRFRLPENFNFPLISTNIQEFWARWHMSLGTFIKRDLYIPLGRLLKGRMNTAIVTSFFLVGLWHNYSIQYAIWGLAHGFALVFYSKYLKYTSTSHFFISIRKSRIWSIMGMIVTIGYVSVLSAFANSDTFEDSISLIKSLLYVG